MTRHRKGLPPLSQSGLIRVPRNARQRVPDGRHQRTTLDAFNETSERTLHPTKGWRGNRKGKVGISSKRGRAQMLMAEIFAGRRMTTAQMGRFIATGM